MKAVDKYSRTVTPIPLEPKAYEGEVEKYGVEGLQKLWMDILERYAHEEYYDPGLVQEITGEEAK